jgi:hypothetical protein
MLAGDIHPFLRRDLLVQGKTLEGVTNIQKEFGQPHLQCYPFRIPQALHAA